MKTIKVFHPNGTVTVYEFRFNWWDNRWGWYGEPDLLVPTQLGLENEGERDSPTELSGGRTS